MRIPECAPYPTYQGYILPTDRISPLHTYKNGALFNCQAGLIAFSRYPALTGCPSVLLGQQAPEVRKLGTEASNLCCSVEEHRCDSRTQPTTNRLMSSVWLHPRSVSFSRLLYPGWHVRGALPKQLAIRVGSDSPRCAGFQA